MDFLYKRATEFDAKLNWSAVLETAKRLRGGENCKIVSGFSVGAYNLVRRIIFEGGVSWVVRARMPSFGGMLGKRDMLPPGQIIRIHVAAMSFLK